MSKRYAIRSLDEARAYLAHPLLGVRYREIVAALQDLDVADATVVLDPSMRESCDRRSPCLLWSAKSH